MFDGVALNNWFDGESTLPDIDFPPERLDLLTESVSWRVDPGFPCEFAWSVTLTVLVESPSPSTDAFVVAPFGPLTEPKPDTFFPAGKAGLSGPLSEAGALADGGSPKASGIVRFFKTRANAPELERLKDVASELGIQRPRFTPSLRFRGQLFEPDIIGEDVLGTRYAVEETASRAALENPRNYLGGAHGYREVQIERLLAYSAETDRTAVFAFSRGANEQVVARIFDIAAERYSDVPFLILLGGP